MSENGKYKLQASTLTELLVLMIVSGLVFIGFMDGMQLFRKITGIAAGKITENSVFHEQYGRLHGLISASDSLLEHRDVIAVYRHDRVFARIRLTDSLLTLDFAGLTDTLFPGVGELKIVSRTEQSTSDSLTVTLHHGTGKKLRLVFGCADNGQFVLERLKAKENHYRYDDP